MKDLDRKRSKDNKEIEAKTNIDEEEVPNLLEEKREWERLSKGIAFGEGL